MNKQNSQQEKISSEKKKKKKKINTRLTHYDLSKSIVIATYYSVMINISFYIFEKNRDGEG